MAIWQDQTIKVETAGQLEVAADGSIHVTWVEDGTTFTLIVPDKEAQRLHDVYERAKGEAVAS